MHGLAITPWRESRASIASSSWPLIPLPPNILVYAGLYT